MVIASMYSYFHAEHSKIHCARDKASGLKTFSPLLTYVQKTRKVWINGPHKRIRPEREKNVEMGTWHKMQFLIQYPTSTCSAVFRFLNPRMSYTIQFPSTSLVLLRSRPTGRMSVFFHHIPHLDDIKSRARACPCHIKSKPWGDLLFWKFNLK